MTESLRSVADDRNGFAGKKFRVGVIVVIDFHQFAPRGKMSMPILRRGRSSLAKFRSEGRF
jgi:hypothetical protein